MYTYYSIHSKEHHEHLPKIFSIGNLNCPLKHTFQLASFRLFSCLQVDVCESDRIIQDFWKENEEGGPST